MADLRQFFIIEIDAEPEAAFDALRRGVGEMNGALLQGIDEERRIVQFKTGVTFTSWGELMEAAVVADGVRSRIEVRGKPLYTFLTTGWGESLHATTIEKRLREAITRTRR